MLSKLEGSRQPWTRRQFMSTVASVAASGTLASRVKLVSAAESTLRDLAAQKGLLYGCATAPDYVTPGPKFDPAFARLVAEQCGLLVPETALNWRYVESSPGQFNFHLGDLLAGFAQTHNMKFGDGPLVWAVGMPDWFNSLSPGQARQTMLNHVTQTVSHYRGKVFSWVVVNEVKAWRASGADLKDTPFLRLVGPDYIEAAFRAAAAADPGALLVHNENHLEYDNADDDYGRMTLLKLLKGFVAKKVPIGAVGIQSHLRTGNLPFSSGKLKDFLSRVADLGLKIIISELDVAEPGPATQLADRDMAVAQELERYLGVVLQEKAVIAVVTWGLAARYTWLTGYAPRADGQPVRPLPYDSNLQPTRAWQALASAFEHAPTR
jgi:endo-1,4-beta-xylanase